MPNVVPLDSRQARIARHLLIETGPTTVRAIASALRLTPRVVGYDLARIEAYLHASGLRIVRRPGVGVWVEGTDERRCGMVGVLDGSSGPRILDAMDRRVRALIVLLDRAPDPLHMTELESELEASRQTVRRDVRDAESWLEEHHLHLQRLPGVGLAVHGDETDVRKALLALVLEAVGVEALFAPDADRAATPATQRPDPLLGFTRALDAATYRSVLSAQMRELDPSAPMTIAASVYLAIVARRVRAGRRARFRSGQLRSLIDHPVADPASLVAAAVERTVGLTLDEADIAAITEFLLGFADLAAASAPDDSETAHVDRVVRTAAERIHPALAEDLQLRRSLAEHIRRLRLRVRYGLPVSNPLDEEVRRRYPDVYEVALGIVSDLGVGAVPAAEAGFLTMYLAGSLERNRLRAKVRVTVVCPAGMATAWILVSRLAAIFPQVEVAQVVSLAEFERSPEVPTDLLISTVPLGSAPERSVVVSPLLRERDIRRLSQLLGEPTR